MSAEPTLALIRELIAAVAQPSVKPSTIEAILAGTGHRSPAEVVTSLPGGRYGADLRLVASREIALVDLEEAFGRSRFTHSLDGDVAAERYWDVEVSDSDRVVIRIELDGTGNRATAVSLTPYTP